MKQGVILKVFLWHSQQQLQKLFSKDIEMKTHDVSHKHLLILELQIERTLNYIFNLDFYWDANQTLGSFFYSESDK